MTQENQMVFDKNKFTMNMLKFRYSMLDVFEHLLEGKAVTSTWFPKTEKEFKDSLTTYENARDTAGVDIMKSQYECYTNPNGTFARELRKYWAFARYMFMNYDEQNLNYYQLIVNKIDVFDEQTQLAVLERLYNLLNYNSRNPEKTSPLLAQIETKVATNKYATISDKYTAAFYMADKNHDIVRDVIEDLKQELHKELKADFPNPENLKKICSYVLSIIDNVFKAIASSRANKIINPVDMTYVNAIKDEFDLKKVLAGGPEYVAKTQETLEERISVAEQQLKSKDEEIHKKDGEIYRLEQDIQSLDTSMYEEKSKLQAEKEKSEDLTRTVQELQKQLEQRDAFIKALRMKMASLKMGVFGNGKEFQAWLASELAKQNQQ